MKLFAKFKKKNNDKVQFFKKKDKKLFCYSTFFQNFKHKRVLKIALLTLIPVSIVSLGAGLKIYDSMNKKNVIDQVEIKNETVLRRVYLLTEDNLTIPLSVNIEKVKTLEEDVIEVFNLLKEDSKVASKHFKGLINKNTRIESMSIDNKLLTLNLSKDFLTSSCSLSLIKTSLVYTMSQYEEIDNLKINVDSLYESEILTRDSKINVEQTSIQQMVNKEAITYFYKRDYDKSSYYIPKTIYVEKETNYNQTFINGSKIRLPSTSLLKKIDLYKNLSKTQTSTSLFTFEITKDGLKEDNLVKNELYNLLMLSLEMMNKDENVSFVLDGEVMKVDGIENSENYEVSSYTYNEIKL